MLCSKTRNSVSSRQVYITENGNVIRGELSKYTGEYSGYCSAYSDKDCSCSISNKICDNCYSDIF